MLGRRRLSRVSLLIVLVSALMTYPADAISASTPCHYQTLEAVPTAYQNAASTLPEPDQSNMMDDYDDVTNDFAARGMLSSSAYYEALIEAAETWDFTWDCAAEAFRDRDITPPVVEMSRPPGLTLKRPISVEWAGTDDGRGLKNVDVRWRRAHASRGYTTWVRPGAWQAATRARLLLRNTAPGYTYCFSIRGRDWAGNTSAWGRPRCTSRPLDDRALVRSANWRQRRARVFYMHTMSSSAKQGAWLVKRRVEARRIHLLATRCAGCGTVGVYWNGRLVKKVRLDYPLREPRTRFRIFTSKHVQKGTVRIRILSRAKRVQIDGLAVHRS